jgi:hypothetical protein
VVEWWRTPTLAGLVTVTVGQAVGTVAQAAGTAMHTRQAPFTSRFADT